jgi:hypothetical protein
MTYTALTVTSHYAEVECRLFKNCSNQIAAETIEEAATLVLAPGERIYDIVLCTTSNQIPHKVTLDSVGLMTKILNLGVTKIFVRTDAQPQAQPHNQLEDLEGTFPSC